jgi:lysophospholipid acyltransferase (LPLAT)-like uncharacterized protein
MPRNGCPSAGEAVFKFRECGGNPGKAFPNPRTGACQGARFNPQIGMISANRHDSKTKLAAPKSRGGVVVPHRAKWHQRLAARMVYGFIRCVAATVRFEMHDGSGLLTGAPTQRIIFSIWHNRLALSLILYRRYLVRFAPERRMAAMVSASRDGGLLARILEHFNVEPVRGSSSRRGPQALRELASWGERGYDLAITPDGPRGPCYQVQEGVISTAQLTGLPILPVSYHLNWKYRPNSWDRFQLPLPFARCRITVGEIVRVPRDANAAEREALRQQLEQRMRAITQD